MSFRKISVFFLIAIVALCSLTGCGSSSKEKKTTLLLDWFANPGHIPLFAGQEKGFFAEEGIDLDILKLADPPSAIPYLQTKQADVVLYYMPSTIFAASRTKDLKILGVLVKEPLDAFVFRKDSFISVSEDFDQKVLGCHPDTVMLTYAKQAMEKKGIEFKQIKKLEIDPVLALYTNMVDVVSSAFWTIEPAQLEAIGIEAGYIKVTDLGVPSYSELIFVTRDDVLIHDPTFKQRFQRALQKSIDFCKKHPDEAFALYLQRHPNKDEKTQKWEKIAWSRCLSTFSDTQEISLDQFMNYYLWMKSHHILEKEVDIVSLLE